MHTVFFDEEDAMVVQDNTWCVVKRDRTFYAQTSVRVDGRQTKRYMHNLIMGTTGIDHINRNGLDNRRCNLRVISQHLQMANQGSRGGSSRFKGVTWNKRRGKWCAKIQVRGKWHHLGYFDDEITAAKAYDQAAVEWYGVYACLNFPEDPPIYIVNIGFRCPHCVRLWIVFAYGRKGEKPMKNPELSVAYYQMLSQASGISQEIIEDRGTTART